MKICRLNARSVIEVSGNDATNFLQSMITNDINKLDSRNNKEFSEIDSSVSIGIYTLFLTPQGRFLYDAFITKNNNSESFSYFLEVDSKHKDSLIKRFTFYKLRSDVQINDLNNLSCFYAKKMIPNDIFDAAILFKDPRYSKLGYRIIANNSQLEKSNLIECLDDDLLYKLDKYEYIIPEGFIDLEQEKSLPPEFHMEDLNAICFKKGCYTGQEVISRTKNLGVVRKSIVGLEFDKNFDLTSLEVFQNGKKLGYITSFYKNKSIALLRTTTLDKNDLVYLSNEDPAKLIIPEWITN